MLLLFFSYTNSAKLRLEEPVIKACKFNNDANLLGALCYYKNNTENH